MSVDAVLCCGILSKLGGVPVARLQRRYFELRESGAFVYYPESNGSSSSSSGGGSGAATIMPALRHVTAAASVSPLGSSPPSSSSSSHAHLHHPHHSAGGVELGEPNGVIYTVGAKIVDRGTYYGKPCFSLEGVNLAKGVKEYFFFADDRESKWKWYQALQIVSGSSFYQQLRAEREQNENDDGGDGDEEDEDDDDESNHEEVRPGHNIDFGGAGEKEAVAVGGGCNALPSHHHPTQQREDAGSPLPSSSSPQHNNKRTQKSPSPSVSKLMCQSPLYAKFGRTKEFRRCADCSSRHPTWSVFVPHLPALVFQRRQRNANSPRRTATTANEPQEGHRLPQQEQQHASVDPVLASATTAALFVCIHCVGVHRSLWAGRCRGVELDKYTEAEVQCFERSVGQHINEYLEFACPPLSSSSSLPASHCWKKPCRQSTRTLREQYIKAKYEQRLFVATDAEWAQYVEERQQRRAAKQPQHQQQNADGPALSTPGATEQQQQHQRQQQHQQDVPPFSGVATDENGEESSAFGGGDHHDAQHLPAQATFNASSYSSAVVPSSVTSTSSGRAAAASLRSYCPPPQDVVERVPPSDQHPYINDLLAAFATPLPQYIGIVHVALRELEGCHSSYTSSSISGIVAVLTNGCQEVRSSPSLKGEKRGTTWRSSGSLSPRGGSSSSASSTTLQLGVDHLERPLFLTFYENNGEGKIAGTAMFSLSSLSSSSNEAVHHPHQPQPPQHPKKDWGEEGMREVSLRVEGRMAGDGSGVVLVQLGVSFLRLA